MNLDPDKNFDSLVFTIARHLLVNHHQHKMYEYLYEKQCKGLPGNDMASETNLIESELDVHLLEELIDRLVEKLPPERRRIFLLSRKQFLTNKQIAEQLHISVNTVETQMTKAISFLRNRLSKLLCFF